jgi:hypothetical protein
MAGLWRLVAWHNGTLTPLSAAARPQPFDVDLGTDARGRTVATFSRCTKTPVTTFDGRTAAWTGAGCRVRVLDVVTGRERAVDVPHPRGTSDTTPSMWRGRLAFARRDPSHRDVAQVLLWSPQTHRLTSLHHGGIPRHCPFENGCKGLTVRGAVEGLDLGAHLATFLWWVDAPGVVGHGGWEVRADRLSDGRSVLAGSGFVGEECTGGTDAVVPSSPAADGVRVWYSRLASSCYVGAASVVRFDSYAGRSAAGDLPGDVLQFAKDGRSLYALIAPKPQNGAAPACSAPGVPCTVERLTPPALIPTKSRPHSPFF